MVSSPLPELTVSSPLLVLIATPPDPILPALARAQLVAGLAAVDYVCDSWLPGEFQPRVSLEQQHAEGLRHHHARGLVAHPGQRLQFLEGPRDLAAVPLDQHLRQEEDVLRLGLEEADGLDVAFQPIEAEREDFLRRVGHRKQAPRGLVDAHIGGLRREQNGSEQLEHARILQLGVGLRVGRFQGGEKRLNEFLLHVPIVLHGPDSLRPAPEQGTWRR